MKSLDSGLNMNRHFVWDDTVRKRTWTRLDLRSIPHESYTRSRSLKLGVSFISTYPLRKCPSSSTPLNFFYSNRDNSVFCNYHTTPRLRVTFDIKKLTIPFREYITGCIRVITSCVGNRNQYRHDRQMQLFRTSSLWEFVLISVIILLPETN